jgi:hypothetical protein
VGAGQSVSESVSERAFESAGETDPVCLHHSCRARACIHTRKHTHTHHWSNSAGATISLGMLAAAPSRIDPHRARQGRSALHLDAP